MELTRKQILASINKQQTRLPRNIFASYDSNDSNENLIVCRYKNEIRIFIESLKENYSKKSDEMNLKELFFKRMIVNTLSSNAESFNLDFQIWHTLNSINDILEVICAKVYQQFFEQYPNFVFDKQVLVDIATKYWIQFASFEVQASFFPIHTYRSFEDSYKFDNYDKCKRFIDDPDNRLLGSMSRYMGLHTNVPVKAFLNVYIVFDNERRLYKSYILDVHYNSAKKQLVFKTA